MSLRGMQLPSGGKVVQPKGAEDVRARGAVSAKQSFQAIFSTHWRATNTDGRRRKLAERRKMLHEKLLPLIPARLPKIDGIRLYVYGFSRGAAAARTFVHWLRDLCDEPTGPIVDALSFVAEYFCCVQDNSQRHEGVSLLWRGGALSCVA